MPINHIKQFPKVLLHEHLDGCIRPKTIIDLANKYDIGVLRPTPANAKMRYI